MYGSSIETPFTCNFSFASQQVTLSPPTPITRFIKYCFAGSGSTPTVIRPDLIRAIGLGSLDCWAPPSQLSGSPNTTTSPRFTSLKSAPNLFTAIRSPICKVFSIEPVGM